MKYCMKCGVLVNEEKNRTCPICDTIILTDDELNSIQIEELKVTPKIKQEKREIKLKEKKNYMGYTAFIMTFSAILSILTLLIIDIAIGFDIGFSLIPVISIMLTLILFALPLRTIKHTLYWYVTLDSIVLSIYFVLLDLIINNRITWSYYVSLSVILAWVYLSQFITNKIKGFILKLTASFIATIIYVLLVSLGLANTSVFSKLVMPIIALVFILTVVSYLFIKTYSYNINVIASRLSISVSILCIGIDLLINRFVHGKLFLQWSYIVLFVLVPFTLIMIYLDHRYKINKYVRKKFHI